MSIILEKKVNCVVFRYKTSKKEKCFHYFIEAIATEWIMANTDKDFKENDLGLLKIMMLLFFTVAASTKNNNDGLLKIFNNFVANPMGHIEADVWDIVKYKKGIIGQFKINSKNLEVIGLS